MLKRKAIERFRFWKAHKTKQALLVTGARQVGKSYLIDEFARQSYSHVASFDFVENPTAAKTLAGATDATDFAFRISALSQEPLVPGETAVVFDEIQECPEVLTYIKYLVDQGDYDYILSGSLLGVALEGVRSLPVGYVTEVQMYPLDFEEFCWAQGVPASVLPSLARNAAQAEPVPDYLHDRLTTLFKRYLIVGGMPDAVVSYGASNSLDQVRVLQRDIRRLYREDIAKYAPKDRRLVIQDIYDLIPSELLTPSKRFRLSSIPDVKRFTQVEDEFLWLTRAGVALGETAVTEPVMPLLAAKKRGAVKLLLSDVGLLMGSYVKQTAAALLGDEVSANLGGVYENYVVQELVAHGFAAHYYSGKRVGELDAVVERDDGEILLFEVKSGNSYKTHAALDNALAMWPGPGREAFVLSHANIERDGNVLYLPLYLAGLFSPENAGFVG